jgi:hypothetical protein
MSSDDTDPPSLPADAPSATGAGGTGTVEQPGAVRPLRVGHRLLPSWAALLGLLVIAFAIQGIAEPGRWEVVFLTVLLGATLLLAFHVAEARPVLVNIARMIVVITVATAVVLALAGHVDERSSRILTVLLVVLAPPAIIVGVVRRMRQTQSVTVEAVLGVLCVYLLAGMFFAFVYGALDQPGGPFFAGGQKATTSNCIYFSFTTLTTIGYGDFTARTNLGHTLAISEGLLGQVYLVTIVSLIVGNLGRRRVR